MSLGERPPANIDARQLAHVLAIAQHGSFIRAAEALGMSQPALSNSIAMLERRLGVPIMERSRRGSQLNASGQILLRHAEGMADMLERTRTEVLLAARGVMGPLTIGVTPSVISRFMPDVLNLLAEIDSEMQISVVENSEHNLAASLQTGGLDVVVGPVAGTTETPEDLIEEVLLEDPFGVVVGPQNPLVLKGPVRLSEIRDAKWALPPRGTLYVEALFQVANAPWPRDCITAASLPLMEAIVRSSERLTIMSKLRSLSIMGPPLRRTPILGAGTRMIGFRLRRGQRLSPLGERFIEALRIVAARPEYAA